MTGSDTQTVLIVDDESPIRQLVGKVLELAGYYVETAGSVAAATEMVANISPDLVILDLGLPDQDGAHFLARLRSWSSLPVIVLSVRGDEAEKVRLLESGADDFVTKPFGSSELIARVRAAMRRAAPLKVASPIELRGLAIDLDQRKVTLNGHAIAMTRKEFGLIAMLARHSGRVVTHGQLLRHLWGPAHVNDVHYTRILVQRLRSKIETDPSAPSFILTELGIGYRLGE